jgi:protein-S-isoprenylcysteine O-methyltransferase Ste14
MQFPLNFQIMVVIGIIIYILGLFFPNYFRIAATKKEIKKSPTESTSSIASKIPTVKLEKVRFIVLIILWGFALGVVFEILNWFSFLPSFLFFLPPSTFPNILTWISLISLLIGSSMSFLAGLALKKDFLFPDEPVRDDWVLCTSGIYKKIRHPFYTFVGIGCIVIPILLGFWPLLILAPFLIFIQYKIALAEEKLMTRHFGEKFIQYKKNSRMFF